MTRGTPHKEDLLPVGDPIRPSIPFARANFDQDAFWKQAGVKAAARAIRRAKGVRGLAWGLRSRSGAWCEEPCLVVYVERKWPKERLQKGEDLRARFKGLPIDVIEVGEARTTAVSAADFVYPLHWAERSAITTALLTVDQGRTRAWLLTCGHGVTPNGAPAELRPQELVVSVSDQQTWQRAAVVHSAEFDGVRDVALLEVDASSVKVDDQHPVLGGAPRHRLRDAPLQLGEGVAHFSPVTGRRMQGFVTARMGATPVTGLEVDAGASQKVFYPELLCVSAEDGAFSQRRDSGSLVVDGAGQVVGTVVAGSEAQYDHTHRLIPMSFVLPLSKGNLVSRSKFINLEMFFQ